MGILPTWILITSNQFLPTFQHRYTGRNCAERWATTFSVVAFRCSKNPYNHALDTLEKGVALTDL